jgi:uncharacterized protein (DUF427 family)
MPRATWNGVVLAEAPADRCAIVEGNVYFPPDAVNRQHFRASVTHTHCPWKGECSYYDVAADGSTNKDAAWYYPDPLPEARHIAHHVAFWRGVQVDR